MNPLVLLLREIKLKHEITQRELSELLGFSLGKINIQINEAEAEGYLLSEAGRYTVTAKGDKFLDSFKVDNAIILAAGFGSRFVPFTYDTPKGLLCVNGQPMIERQIEQLREASITDISIVVGYLKEKFDYLIDKYGVKLIYNPEYATKNNFVSVYYAADQLKNTYLLVSDDYIEDNIFHTYEPDSWLCCTYFKGKTREWGVTTGSHNLISHIDLSGEDTWALNGPSYFTADFSKRFSQFVKECYDAPGTDNYYWENILEEHLEELPIYINKQSSENIHEFENLEELRMYDDSYVRDTDNEVMCKIAETFNVSQSEIIDIHPVKEGMTNQSFVFSVDDASYVFRLPGKGTEQLLSRANEKRSYELVAPLDISDEIVFFDGETGIKISKFYDDANVLDADDDGELKRAMELLAKIHGAGIEAEHRFDIEQMINFYEKIANDNDAIRFTDYKEVRVKADELLLFRNRLGIPEILCHIDYIFANLLCLNSGEIRVIDWEYSGAADPIIDIAMFSIYSYFPRERADLALSYYLGRAPEKLETARLYMYMALAGFLWALWCEYKQSFGEEFGDYPMVMYRYMKDYYSILKEEGYLDE
jgi:CTP:phosphocholine cytidylyltransferase-like protein/thiamine kinase-like enzyme